MRSLALLAVLLTASWPAVAQVSDSLDWQQFYPLEVGDTWEYGASDRECFMGSCSSSTAYYRRTIVGKIEVEGVQYAEMQVEQFDSTTGSVTCTSMHNVRVNPETDRVEIGGLPGCYGFASAPFAGIVEGEIPLTLGLPSVETVNVGGIEYDLEVRYVDEVGTCFDLCEAWFARDIGLVGFSAYSDLGPGDRSSGFGLEYAEVGGVVYGQQVVANEAAAPPAAFQLATVYPNPFRTTATFALILPAPEAVTLAVFDVLGRRVLTRDLGVQPAGESRPTLDGSALPAGVYFVRATTASGQQATRRVVRIE